MLCSQRAEPRHLQEHTSRMRILMAGKLVAGAWVTSKGNWELSLRKLKQTGKAGALREEQCEGGVHSPAAGAPRWGKACHTAPRREKLAFTCHGVPTLSWHPQG